MRSGNASAAPAGAMVAEGSYPWKLRMPVVSVHYVPRPRLVAVLDAVLETPLTLVVAPAGSGKTTLLAAWAASSSVPTAWLSVDEPDRDAAQLWTGLLAALESLRPGCGARAAERLRHPGALMSAVAELIDDVSAGDAEPAVLVIDDLHAVGDQPEVAASLARFLEQLPPWLHVVLATRRVPELPLHRMRVRAQLAELRFDELRFSADEARALLERLAPTLSEEELVATVERADGWVASMQLAALAARSQAARPTHDAPGVDQSALTHDYVMREVLAAEDPELVRTLLEVSVVERLHGELAEFLTGRADAVRLLRRAEDRGLFVTRIGPDGWFTVHSLLRSVLRSELSRQPGRLAQQHERAAQWFTRAGEPAVALEHLMQSGDLRAALRLLAAKHAELYDNGREATIRRVIAAIPAEVAARDLDTLVDFASCHLLVNRRRFAELVDQLTWWSDRSPAGGTMGARIRILAAIAAMANGDWNRGGRLAGEALGELGGGWWRDPLGRFGWNIVARELALSERWDDVSDEVHEIDLALSRDPQRLLVLQGTRALGEILAGRPVDALRVVAGVRHTSETQGLSTLTAELGIAEAMAQRERGDRTAAVEALEAIAATPAETMYYCRVLAALELAMAAHDETDLDEARRRFADAVGLVKEESGPGWWDWVARIGTRLALATGDLAEAGGWAQRIDDPFWRPISRARVQLGAGEAADALATLEGVEPRCVRHEVVLSLLRGRASSASDESTKHLATALEMAAAAGLVQTVVSEGATILERVEHAAWRLPREWVDQLRRLGNAVAIVPTTGVADRHGRPDPRLVLTDRERDVLRFLPSRLTQREIAAELYVSVNTLKFHLKVIYRKLGVASRAEAAELARRAYGIR